MDTIKMQSEDLNPHIDLDSIHKFFRFFEEYDVEYFFLEAMPRKKSGDRGAPIAKQFGITRPIGGANGMVHYIARLSKLMQSYGKRADLHIKESPGAGKYHRILLIDDLELHFLEALIDDFPGPIVGLETSKDNYQALLIAPKEPRGLFATEVLKVQRALAREYSGDLGAVAAGQYHRFASSPNYKHCTNGEAPYLSQIVCMRPHIENPVLGAEGFFRKILEDKATQPGTVIGQSSTNEAPKSALPSLPFTAGRDLTESGIAFGHALQLLKKGSGIESVVAQIEARWGAGRSPNWSQRTVWNAQYVLGHREERYTSLDKA